MATYCGCNKESTIGYEWGVGGAVDDPTSVFHSLLMVLPLDEEEGPYRDLGRFGLDALEGDVAPTRADGTFCSYCQAFTSVDKSFISLGAINLRSAEGFAFSVWVRPSVLTQEQTIFNSGFCRLYLTSNGEVGLETIGTNKLIQVIEASDTLDDESWYFVSASYTRSSVSLYLNGSLIRTDALDVTIDPYSTSATLGRGQGGNTFLDGFLQTFSVHLEARDAAYWLGMYENLCSDAFYLWGEQSYASPD